MLKRSSSGIAGSKPIVKKVHALYDERFCRMWEFYLQLCEVGYRRLGGWSFRRSSAKRVSTVPLTRSYLAGWDGAQR